MGVRPRGGARWRRALGRSAPLVVLGTLNRGGVQRGGAQGPSVAGRGLSGDVLTQATDAIAQSKENWIGMMLTDEYGLAIDDPAPMRAAITTFIAFLIAGAVPLVPFVLAMPNAFAISVFATLFTFFLIGTGKSRWSQAKWWWSGSETLMIGGVAALLAYGVGGLFHPG